MNQSVVNAIDKQMAAHRETCVRAANRPPEFMTTFAPSDMVLADAADDVVDCGALDEFSQAAWAFSDQLIGFAGVAPESAVAEAYMGHSSLYADYAVVLRHRAILCGLA